MTNQHYITPATPHFGLVVIIGEVIAPAATIITTALISVFTHLTKRGKRQERTPSTALAPHVAMVMVPGNFLTGPFIKR